MYDKLTDLLKRINTYIDHQQNAQRAKEMLAMYLFFAEYRDRIEFASTPEYENVYKNLLAQFEPLFKEFKMLRALIEVTMYSL